MKVPPLNLNPDVSKIGISLPFSPDLLWRYPMALPQTLPSSPLHDVKNQMPTNLAADPRIWSREDVSYFLRWFEREFELPSIDISKFCMNGKALCMLTKTDLAERAPGAGDILHNTLQFLLRDSPQVPQSPLTPQHPLLSPSPLTPTHGQGWPIVKSEIHNLSHLLQQGGSVTLSPAPSDQSGGSPRHTEPSTNGTSFQNSSSGPSGSDSEESTRDSNSPQMLQLPQYPNPSTFSIQALASLKQLTDYQRAVASASAAQNSSVKSEMPTSTSQNQQQFYPSMVQTQAMSDEPVETVTNGRLLWDFLQQLLNDKEQRYSQYITWKNRETGVFKIVDPPGLARLWGIQKNHLSMNYDKMSRALRYYYRVNILRKVQGERHCYQFLRDPLELKSIKNLSLLRGAPIPSIKKWESSSNTTNNNNNSTVMEEDEGPTDLSMSAVYPQFSSQNSQIAETPVYSEPQNLVLDKSENFVKTEETKEH